MLTASSFEYAELKQPCQDLKMLPVIPEYDPSPLFRPRHRKLSYPLRWFGIVLVH